MNEEYLESFRLKRESFNLYCDDENLLVILTIWYAVASHSVRRKHILSSTRPSQWPQVAVGVHRWLCSLCLGPCCGKWALLCYSRSDLCQICLICKWEISQYLGIMICWRNWALIKVLCASRVSALILDLFRD